MSKLGVVVDVLKGARKVDTAADAATAAKAAAKADTARSADAAIAEAARQSRVSQRPTAAEIAYDHNASLKSEGYTEALKPVPVDAQKVVDELEVTRQRRLYEPDSDVDYTYQTRGPEEFKERLFKQFSDPDYAARASKQMLSPPPPKELVAERLMDDFVFQVKMTGGVLKNRTLKRAISWLGDSPYRTTKEGRAPRVFVHIDRQTDQTRMNDFIQFDEPMEMGLHSGTNQAAIEATLNGDPGLHANRMRTLDDSLVELSKFSEDPDAFMSQFYQTLEQHFIAKFNKGSEVNWELWEETQELLEAQLFDLGAPTQLASSYIAKAKNLSTASSTPHLFRGKNGLYMYDNGGFGPEEVYRQLYDMFPDNRDALDAAMSNLGSVAKQKGLQKFIEDQGFDHIVYHNTVEDVGTLSIINWNRDLYLPLLDKSLVGGDGGIVAAKVAMAMAAVGLGVKAEVPEGG